MHGQGTFRVRNLPGEDEAGKLQFQMRASSVTMWEDGPEVLG